MYIRECNKIPDIIATTANIYFSYRAPARYLAFAGVFLCIGGIASFFFAAVEPWVFRAVILFLMSVSLAGGVGFLAAYMRSLAGRIGFSQNALTLPYRHRGRPVVLDYSEISVAEEMRTYGRLLKITSADGRQYILDENRIRKGRFDEILRLLRERVG